MKVRVRGGGGGMGEGQSTGQPFTGADRVAEAPSAHAASVDPGRSYDRRSLIVFGVYIALSIVFLGRALIFDYPGSYEGRGPDPSLFIWAIAWWPYAISHRLNPFLTEIIFAPSGTNLAWTTTIPLASLLVSPITAAWGPVAAYNCLALLAPALAAWTTFTLCRYLTKTFWPAILGGYIFGFSPYILAQTLGGHLHLVLIFPVLVALCLTARWFEGMIKSSKAASLLGLTLAAQFFLSVEIFTTMTMFAALAVFLSLSVTTGANRRRIVRMTGVLACAYGLALLIATPYIYYLFAYGQPKGEIWDTVQFSADLLNFLIPTNANALGTLGPMRKLATIFPGNEFERTAYLGPILIGVAIVYACRHWQEPLGRVLIDSMVIICVLSFGPTLHFGGRELIDMPGKGLAVMPAIDKALPVRFTMYAFLIVAIMTSLWLATSAARARTKRVVVLLAVIFSLPNLEARYWITKVDTPAFFAKGLYEKYISPGENVIVAPYWILGHSMLWQAQAGMYFRMAGGYTGQLPDEYVRWPVIDALTEWTPLPDPQTQLMSFLANHQVGAIIVSDDDPARSLWQRWVLAAVAAPIEVGGVTLYRIPPSALLRYRTVTATEVERQADTALFNGLLAAASKYDADGRKPELLTPFAAEKIGLISSDWLPGPVWAPVWMAGTKFDMTLDANKPMYRGVWLGYAAKTFLGIGIKGTYEGLKPIIDRYSTDAYRIYFPFPQKFAEDAQNGDRGFLLMFFKPDGLKHAIAASAKLAPEASNLPGP